MRIDLQCGLKVLLEVWLSRLKMDVARKRHAKLHVRCPLSWTDSPRPGVRSTPSMTRPEPAAGARKVDPAKPLPRATTCSKTTQTQGRNVGKRHVLASNGGHPTPPETSLPQRSAADMRSRDSLLICLASDVTARLGFQREGAPWMSLVGPWKEPKITHSDGGVYQPSGLERPTMPQMGGCP